MKKQDNKKQEAKAKKQEAKAKKQEEKAKKQQAKKEAKAKKQKEKQAAKAKKQEAKAKKQAAKKGKKEGSEEGGKRKLNLKVVIPLALVLLAAGGAGAFFFLNGGEELQPPTAYMIGEESTIVLDGFLEEGGKIQAITLQQPESEDEPEQDKEEDKKDESQAEDAENAEPQPVPIDTIALYDYIGVTPAALEQYLDALLAEEEGFVLVDDGYNKVEQRPVFAAEEAADDKEAENSKEDKDDKDDKDNDEAKTAMAAGTILLAREASVEGRLFQVRLTWTAEGECNVEVSCPEAAFPAEPMMNSGGALDYMRGQRPEDLGLPGESMSQYNIYNQEGSVVLDGKVYRKFIVYELDDVTNTNAFVGEFLISGDGRTIYKRDENGELQRVK